MRGDRSWTLPDLLEDRWQLTNTLRDGDPSNDPKPDTLAELSDLLGEERECVGSQCP